MVKDQSKLAPGALPSAQMLVDCAECDKPVIAIPRGFVLDASKSKDEDGVDGPYFRYTLVECEKEHPILVTQVDTGEDLNSFVWNDPLRIFPPRERQLRAC
jgi:hypothetical protein